MMQESLKYLLTICFFALIPSVNATENYCHDEETNQQWNTLETMSGTHPDLVDLSKYRTELCSKVDLGELSVEQATVEFETERERVLKRVRNGSF